MFEVPRRKPVPPSISPASPSPPASLRPPSVAQLHDHASSRTYPIDLRMAPSNEFDDDDEFENGHKTMAYERVDTAEEGTDARRRRKSHHLDFFTIIADCAVIFLPLAVLGFVIHIWRLDGQMYFEGSLDTWRNAITVLATAFPILFAAIVGRLMSATAHWKLERGAEIGLLEILMGSRTVGSTVITLFQLRIVTFVTVGLLALWSVSPLGAQAFLRMLSTKEKIESNSTTATYYDCNNPSMLGYNIAMGYESYPAFENIITNIYTMLLLTPNSSRSSPVDAWGNLKIPLLVHDEDDSSDEGWKSVSHDNSGIWHVSLLGIPINDSLPIGNTSFSLESNYLDLRCPDFTTDQPMPEIQPITGSAGMGRFSGFPNGTWWGTCDGCDTGSPTWSLAVDRFVDEYWVEKATASPKFNHTPVLFSGEETLDVGSTQLLFEAKSYPDTKVSSVYRNYSTICEVRQMYVESRVNCTRTSETSRTQPGCEVVAQRLSRRQHPSSLISFMSFPVVFVVLSKSLPSLFDRDMGYAADFTLQYLYNTEISGLYHVPLDEVPGEEFGKRLSQLLNTYIGASQLGIEATRWTARPQELWGDFNPRESPADTTWFQEYVDISQAWILVCLISCLILVISGIISVVLTHWARGPEVLGYVSSSLRDSRFTEISPEIRGLNGLDLTRQIRKRRVRLGAVQTSHGQVEEETLLGIGDEDGVERIR